MCKLNQVKTELVDLLPRLQRYAGNLSASQSDADDLVQLTCVRVLEKYEQFSQGTHFDRWAYTVMSSVRSNTLRAQKKLVSLNDTDVQLSVADTSETITYYHQVLAHIKKLNIGQREVMLLVYIEGFSYDEAAEILAVPVGTVMSRIARARVKLAEKLERKHRSVKTWVDLPT